MIVDTSVLVATADVRDGAHGAAVAALRLREVRFVPEPVVAETDSLIATRVSAEAERAFVRSLSEGSMVIVCPAAEDRARAAEIAERYADAAIGYTDAVIAAIAERLGETTIATLDRRHFSLIRPRHIAAFDLVPQ